MKEHSVEQGMDLASVKEFSSTFQSFKTFFLVSSFRSPRLILHQRSRALHLVRRQSPPPQRKGIRGHR